jgi:lipopolysaccharide transport system ATP-binding protein
MNSIIVSLENVGLVYSSRSGFLKRFRYKALDKINLDVERGEILGILGKNGSGKSTLLKILAGIYEPDEGSITIKDGISRSLLTLGLGFKPQLSGRDNALISCMMNGMSKNQAKNLLNDIKEFSGLDEFFEQPVKSYSSGMRSRLGFSVGVLLDVDLLLIDEVLSVGDAEFKKKAERALMDIINSSSRTVIFVSHNDKQIEKLCTRCAWLDKGRLKKIGSLTSVLGEYRESELNNIKK